MPLNVLLHLFSRGPHASVCQSMDPMVEGGGTFLGALRGSLL